MMRLIVHFDPFELGGPVAIWAIGLASRSVALTGFVRA
jgi:hypothetical protein